MCDSRAVRPLVLTRRQYLDAKQHGCCPPHRLLVTNKSPRRDSRKGRIKSSLDAGQLCPGSFSKCSPLHMNALVCAVSPCWCAAHVCLLPFRLVPLLPRLSSSCSLSFHRL